MFSKMLISFCQSEKNVHLFYLINSFNINKNNHLYKNVVLKFLNFKEEELFSSTLKPILIT